MITQTKPNKKNKTTNQTKNKQTKQIKNQKCFCFFGYVIIQFFHYLFILSMKLKFLPSVVLDTFDLHCMGKIILQNTFFYVPNKKERAYRFGKTWGRVLFQSFHQSKKASQCSYSTIIYLTVGILILIKIWNYVAHSSFKGGAQCCFMNVELFTLLKSWILMLNMA